MVTRSPTRRASTSCSRSCRCCSHLPLRLAILGSGDAELAAALAGLAAEHAGRFAFVDGYDERLSHLMFAAGDLYLMPSRFEPCGLTQMQAMRYGTIPVVTPVGGLLDTVPDADADRDGCGFVADRVGAGSRSCRRCCAPIRAAGTGGADRRSIERMMAATGRGAARRRSTSSCTSELLAPPG